VPENAPNASKRLICKRSCDEKVQARARVLDCGGAPPLLI